MIPGDKIVINKAVLWLGAAAVFYLPKLVIPLRTVDDQRARPQFFPEVGYDSYEGAWIKIHVPFGKDQYYYGYYIVNYFTKLGLGIGYVGFYASRKGRRTVSINLYGQNNTSEGGRTYNAAIQEQENFSQHLRGNFQYTYQSNFGALTNIPPNESLSARDRASRPETIRRTIRTRTARWGRSRAATVIRSPILASSIKTSTKP